MIIMSDQLNKLVCGLSASECTRCSWRVVQDLIESLPCYAVGETVDKETDLCQVNYSFTFLHIIFTVIYETNDLQS